VLIAYLSEDESEKKTSGWIRSAGAPRLLMRRLILARRDNCSRWGRAATAEYGHLDSLGNNAGISRTHAKLADFPARRRSRRQPFAPNIYSMFLPG